MATTSLTVQELQPRLEQLTVIDVRSPGEFASGHIPGAHNVPLDQVQQALPVLRKVAERGEIAVVCASGARSQNACNQLAAAGIAAATVVGGTSAWAQDGKPLNRPAGARTVWAMDRQVRLAAGTLVLIGLLGDLALPGLRWLSAGVGAGLVFSALTNTCAMGNMLGKLPYNRRAHQAFDLNAALNALRG
ncbi:rhodanese-like domain-containing protein [Peterkaempfera sp. SMS 1(5)a]|uniref:rhodanese-like domain-containing protein n=1 Tax=Peterkaempfera podocarpi TaxID=3232308 RepID=UPI003673450C